MALNYENLDGKTRPFMLREVELDLSRGNLYLSPRLNEHGQQNYVSLLKEAIGHYNDAWLADQLDKNACMAEFELRKQSGVSRKVKVPVNAHQVLSEGEFNRFYIRGVCARVIHEGFNQIEVYRGKSVKTPRSESQAMIGKKLPAEELLKDLRASIGVDTAFGLPSGPNSGLTVRMFK